MTAFIAQLDWCTLQKELGRVGGSLCQAFKQWRGATCGRTYVDKQAHPTVVVARETAVSRSRLVRDHDFSRAHILLFSTDRDGCRIFGLRQ